MVLEVNTEKFVAVVALGVVLKPFKVLVVPLVLLGLGGPQVLQLEPACTWMSFGAIWVPTASSPSLFLCSCLFLCMLAGVRCALYVNGLSSATLLPRIAVVFLLGQWWQLHRAVIPGMFCCV